MTAPLPLIRPAAVADAYARTAAGGSGGNGFGAVLERAVGGAVGVEQKADAQSMQAIQGKGNLTEVVTAVSQAELTLQTATAIRDRVVQAYQTVMQMPI